MAQFGQQGPKLVGFLSAGSVAQGSSIALSADGNTAMVGGPSVDAGTGVAWVYIRSADVWSEQDELVGTGAAGNAMQGTSVALSADGNTAIVGGPGDNDRIGAAWVLTRSGGGHGGPRCWGRRTRHLRCRAHQWPRDDVRDLFHRRRRGDCEVSGSMRCRTWLVSVKLADGDWPD
jgi:FG-GAP repeat